MTRPIVYGEPFHLNVRGVLFALAEKEVAYRVEPRTKLTLAEGARAPLYGEPVLDVGGFVVEGTETVLRFVADGFSGPPLVPEDARTRARMNRALELNYVEAARTFGSNIAGRYLGALVTGDLDPGPAEDAMTGAQRTVTAFERILGADDYLAGRFSIADIALGSLVANVMETPAADLVLPPETPLRMWWQRIAARRAFVSTTPKGGALFGFMRSD